MLPERLQRLYGPSYFIQRYPSAQAREVMYRLERARLYEFKRGGRILDIGCGLGGFLDCLDDRWEKHGIEPSDFAAAASRQKGINVQKWNTDWPLTWGDECFDAIVLRGTLQHLDRPMFILWQAHRMLKPGGLLAVTATPNTGSLCFRLFQQIPALDPARNFWLVSDGELVNALKNCGFETTQLVYPYWGTPYAHPLRDCLRFIAALLGFYRPFAWPGNQMECWAVKNGA